MASHAKEAPARVLRSSRRREDGEEEKKAPRKVLSSGSAGSASPRVNPRRAWEKGLNLISELVVTGEGSGPRASRNKPDGVLQVTARGVDVD